MTKWTDFTVDERKAMIQTVIETKQIDEPSAEKDWWVTAVLYAMFHTSISDYLLFKGGTSLSKGWNIIHRFSVDEKLKELGLDVTVVADNEVLDDEGQPRKVPHDKDPSVIYVHYPTLYTDNSSYTVPTIKIEISVLSMDEPFEPRRISSLIEEVYSDEDVDSDFIQTIRTVSPARTLLEKAFLLCEEYQKPKPRTHRMSRHFYDLEKLMHTPYVDLALKDLALYGDIVEHRRYFYHVGSVDYDKELPDKIQIIPDEKLRQRQPAVLTHHLCIHQD